MCYIHFLILLYRLIIDFQLLLVLNEKFIEISGICDKNDINRGVKENSCVRCRVINQRHKAGGDKVCELGFGVKACPAPHSSRAQCLVELAYQAPFAVLHPLTYVRLHYLRDYIKVSICMPFQGRFSSIFVQQKNYFAKGHSPSLYYCVPKYKHHLRNKVHAQNIHTFAIKIFIGFISLF